MNAKKSIKDIKKLVRSKIDEKLQEMPSNRRGNQDARWYYMAPLMMDGAKYSYTWLESGDQLADYDDGDEGARRKKGFKTHLNALLELFHETHREKFENLGRRPDDLADVLTDMAIASPAICINRTYQNYLSKGESLPSYMPSQLARIFINRMNTPEATAVVELACGRKSDDAHWQNLLTYCRQGNLQAVFDEYAHLVSNGIDRDGALIFQMHRQMIEAMDIRTTLYNVDTYTSFQKRVSGKKEKPTNIRTHFAVAFTKGEGKETDTDRKKTIRNAFNSPFRPFVLATTSIGQEGLDFHNYCRRIVHWNLPSNPIDLEQREGRINRFKCLAVRQNIARRYGDEFSWDAMFAHAAKELKGEYPDLVPYWCLPDLDGNSVKIERIVPMYPFSQDQLRYDRIIKILSLYRLTLGQPRQEELISILDKELAEGHRLIRAQGCDNFDPVEGCLGHPLAFDEEE